MNNNVDELINSFIFDYTIDNQSNEITTPKYKTGIYGLDTALNGGLPIGKIVGIGSEKGVGKTTLLIHACCNIIELYNKKVIYLDVEGGVTPELLNSMGFDNLLFTPNENPEGKFILLRPSTIQEIAKIIKTFSSDPEVGVIVIDSENVVIDGEMIKKDDLGMSDKSLGSDTRMWSKMSKPLTYLISKSKACLVLVRQARITFKGFKAIKSASGGNATKHMSSVELWCELDSYISDNYSLTNDKENSKGALIRLTTTKNRLTKPYSTIKLYLYYGEGISNLDSYIDWLKNHTFENPEDKKNYSYIRQKNSWFEFYYEEDNPIKVQGYQKLRELIHKHLDYVIQLVEEYEYWYKQ